MKDSRTRSEPAVRISRAAHDSVTHTIPIAAPAKTNYHSLRFGYPESGSRRSSTCRTYERGELIMLTIRKHQIAILNQDLRARFQERMVAHIAAEYPTRFSDWGGQRTGEFVAA